MSFGPPGTRQSIASHGTRLSCTMKKKSKPSEKAMLLQAPLDMLILQTLQWRPEHGHGIGQAIQARSGDLLSIEAGSLYPALHRLGGQGPLAAGGGGLEKKKPRA